MSNVIFICPYCGNEYGACMECCGEHWGHGIWVIDDDDSGTIYATRGDAEAALENKT